MRQWFFGQFFVCSQKFTPKRQRPPKMEALARLNDEKALKSFLRLENLTATIHTGLQVYVMRAMQFAGIGALHIGIGLNGIMRATHVAFGGRGFPLRNSHGRYPLSTCMVGLIPPAKRSAGCLSRNAWEWQGKTAKFYRHGKGGGYSNSIIG